MHGGVRQTYLSSYGMSSLKLNWYAFRALSLISDVNTHFVFIPSSAAASSNPILIPPSPANRSINFIV